MSQILQKAGFKTETAESAEKGLEELRHALYDAIVLDVNLPGLSGMKMCELLKQDPSTVRLPIIMLTAESDSRSKVQGLVTGADDYITKPPVPEELVARLNALLRRVKYAGAPAQVLEVKDLRMDLDRHEVFVQGKSVPLRPKEFQLLALFLEKKGRALPRSAIFETLWPGELVTEHTLEVHVNHLRDKLGPLSTYLQTIPGFGYKFQD
ncbi:MAG: response regulator transcription factor [Elusimicrobia bacterium]|nr:response regulator transcription factor [Elusimicrobiota bacterium]